MSIETNGQTVSRSFTGRSQPQCSKGFRIRDEEVEGRWRKSRRVEAFRLLLHLGMQVDGTAPGAPDRTPGLKQGDRR